MEDAQDETSLQTIVYTYHDTAERISAQIATMRTTRGTAVDITYSYTYDNNGNILTVSDGTNTTSYVYDSANQLIRENNQAAGKTWTWTYDSAGNILSKNEYAYTTGDLGTPTDAIPYTYNDADWGDLLTAYDGTAITYDTIGNPLNDGTWTYTWRNGRELATMSDGTVTWRYTYDANGMRTRRSGNNVPHEYEYIYNGGSLSQVIIQEWQILTFTYDANGIPMTVNYEYEDYSYITNLQGDVVGIADSTGTLVVSYTYDAWGKPLSITGPMADTLGVQNPLRYRGYVYDQETGLYYLQSRYYDPEIGRFINVDTVFDIDAGVQGYNLFLYCANNPVNRIDISGTDSVSIENLDITDDQISSREGGTGGTFGRTLSSFMDSLRDAANGLSMATGQRNVLRYENHHILSNKSQIYTPQYQEVVDRYNMSLTAQENVVSLPGHQGRHTNKYHEIMLSALWELDNIANGDITVFRYGLGIMADWLKANPWIPYAK